jgi:hypothetical protein
MISYLLIVSSIYIFVNHKKIEAFLQDKLIYSFDSEAVNKKLPAEFILELISASIQSGASIQTALIEAGKAVRNFNGSALQTIGTKLLLGESWDLAWENSVGLLSEKEWGHKELPGSPPVISHPDKRSISADLANMELSNVELKKIKECLENSWYRGSSPVQAIDSYILDLSGYKDRENRKVAEQLSVKIVTPLGLCFLPSFIFIGVLPVLIALLGQLN